MNATIYHNPRCSKSRATLELLRRNGIEPAIVEYLKTPPSRDELESLVASLGGKVRDIVRSGESVYGDLGLDAESTDDVILDAIVDNPILLQRPIVSVDGRAAIGRPPENVLDLFRD